MTELSMLRILKKTENGNYVSTYECDSKTVQEEFLLTKREYQQSTGRQQKNDVIAYMIRQSFKSGEITPKEANRIGYELGIRFTKGRQPLSWIHTPIRPISIITLFSIQLHWTLQESSTTFGSQDWQFRD